MKVKVIDRSTWGTPGLYPLITEIEIPDNCPKCGGKRGEPENYYFFENGDTHLCQVWHNPCGHVDKYKDVLKEAKV